MRMFFNHITDIAGKKKRYPKSANYTAFFFTSDAEYYIYALCTKSDFTGAELIQVDLDTYNNAKDMLSSTGEIAEIALHNSTEIQATIQFIKLQSTSDNLTLGDLLNLN